MAKREMEDIGFKQIAVGRSPGGDDVLYGLTEGGKVFFLHTDGYWSPMVMQAPKAVPPKVGITRFSSGGEGDSSKA
jgi:hypothetical protein